MDYHILNGDALFTTFKESGIPGEVIICRECLIEGPLYGDTLDDFFNLRSGYIQNEYIHDNSPEADKSYDNIVASELKKIISIPAGSKVTLWFEHDLFCQVNMWFILSLLNNLENISVFRVLPYHRAPEDVWKGFGDFSDKELLTAYENNKILLKKGDVEFGSQLWLAYTTGNDDELQRLSLKSHDSFPWLKEVCKAHIDRFPSEGNKGRPEKTIEEIVKSGKKEFAPVFIEFSKREGIYGFGDRQVKRMYDKIVNS